MCTLMLIGWGTLMTKHLPQDMFYILGILLLVGLLKKQRTVARSSTEAEYWAIATALAETNWVMNLMTELQLSFPVPPTIYCDNVGDTNLCRNPVFHSRMKQIALDSHFV